MASTIQELKKKGFRSVVTFKESKHYLEKMEKPTLLKLLKKAWKKNKTMRDFIRKEVDEVKKDETWFKAPAQKVMLKSNWGVPLVASENSVEFLRFPTNDICLGKFNSEAVSYYWLPMWHDWDNETLVLSKTRLDDSVEYKEKYYVTFEQTVGGKKERLRIEPALERFEPSCEDQEREQFRKDSYFAYREVRKDGRWFVPLENMPEEYGVAREQLREIREIFAPVNEDEDSDSD
uniref:Uncharacterized protein n=1 Tax=Clytia hemisphaerica TaxID=252671 RepID=A0A7M5V9A0_9CNID